MKNTNLNLGKLFFELFEVKIAQTDEEKHHSYRLRYQIYCHDFGYIDPSVYPDQIEKDEFDHGAIHCLVIHKPSGQLVGSVRCLRPKKNCQVLPHLPFEQICKGKILPEHQESIQVSRDSMIEISRITVNQSFRDRNNNQISEVELKLAEKTSLILALCAYTVAAQFDTVNAFAIMESMLAKKLNNMGIPCYRRGEDMKFYGIRALYYLDVEQLGKTLPNNYQQILTPIKEQLFQ